jgi:hypothetical protein
MLARQVDGRHHTRLGIDVQRLQRAQQVGHRIATGTPDRSSRRLTITRAEVGEVHIRFLHQEGGARGRAAAADALRLQEHHLRA